MQHIGEPIEPLLRLTLDVAEGLYERGFRRFLCGGATGFDTLAASAVLILKQRRPDAQLILVFPCEDQEKSWKPHEQALYRSIREQADRVIVLADHYYNGCMMTRNRFMVDHAAFCVAYWKDTSTGGTISTIRLALRRGLPVLNIAVPEETRLFLRDTDLLRPLPF
ncbi:MAG: DUF1273 family protein [Clostridia bacterium]|nr:DUF1273 family protein [Clostridia bacterium]